MLPIGTQPDAGAGRKPAAGAARRQKPQLRAQGGRTTLVAAVVWFGAWLVIASPYVSFRHGWLALHDE